jgi:hypothetical protein
MNYLPPEKKAKTKTKKNRKEKKSTNKQTHKQVNKSIIRIHIYISDNFQIHTSYT